MTRPQPISDPRLDRASDTLDNCLKQDTPWQTAGQRGHLNLATDISAHRRAHSLFEDLMN